ncbi:hypothetical protein CO181_02330 [candidate division WWE3 bacterium CG_4_9_14_3_um_filter_43_9]|uniref:Uncharacterized protein n=2 Tax=Katanobacteria TaxID=422282 RepID=A0A2M7WXE8_UNCKA|nr:MAG: hypothetical protein CO181_02330 [candidate division WWE3 bacterium CG_4_9_14_3_um_filter_43_9]
MHVLIFAGGAGTRLWPLSRKNTPKQFEKVFNGKSTLQLTVDRVAPTFSFENIYISTNEKYVAIVKEQIPEIPTHNIIAEPAKRDVAPALGYNLMHLKKTGGKGPVAIIFSDHLMKNVTEFIKALKTGEKLVRRNPKRIVFIGNKARYVEPNLGWIQVGKKLKKDMYEYKGWIYRPPLEECKKMFASRKWIWNLGYWVLDLDFTISLYHKYAPQMYQKLKKIEELIGTNKEYRILKKIYPTMQSISLDNAIIEKLKSEAKEAIVLTPDLGWSDPGTLYALKEALQDSPQANVSRGEVLSLDSQDCLIFNYESNKIVTTVGLSGYILVNMNDALIVVKKEDVPKVKKLVELLEKKGFAKYI